MLFFVELPCKILVPLEDKMEEFESKTAKFAITLSKPRSVSWKKGVQEVAGERFEISVSGDGLEHVLMITDLSSDDKGVYMAHVDDNKYGTLRTTTKLYVKGVDVF